MQESRASKSALQNKNLRLYFAGQVVSMIGTWMQQMALGWLIYRLTNSPFMLGVVALATQAPSLLLTPFAGIIADRVNRHRLILITQTASMVQAGVLAALVLLGHPQLWQLVVLCALLGIITAFDLPARQTFLVDMLDSNDELPSAIAINSSINTITRLIGPFVAGLLVAWVGEGLCFLINALSYIAVVVALLFVKAQPSGGVKSQQNSLEQLKTGFAYAFGYAPIRDLIFLLTLIGFFAMPFAMLMPAFAKDVFHGNASTLGYLTAASGGGSVIGALSLASRKGTMHLGRRILIGCSLVGVGLVALGFCQNFFLALPLVVLVGFGSMTVLAGSNTLIQTVVDPDKRGRVMSIFIMAFMGVAPFGCMIAGALANFVGPGNTVEALGVVTMGVAVAFASRLIGIYDTAIEPASSANVRKDSELEPVAART